MNKKRIIVTVSIVAGAALISGGVWYKLKDTTASKVEVYPVSNLTDSYMGEETTLSGNVTSDALNKIYLDGENTVSKVYVKEGDNVKEGDKLFKYDVTLAELDLQSERLNYQSMEIKMSSLQKDLEKLKKITPIPDSTDSTDTTRSNSTSTSPVIITPNAPTAKVTASPSNASASVSLVSANSYFGKMLMSGASFQENNAQVEGCDSPVFIFRPEEAVKEGSDFCGPRMENTAEEENTSGNLQNPAGTPVGAESAEPAQESASEQVNTNEQVNTSEQTNTSEQVNTPEQSQENISEPTQEGTPDQAVEETPKQTGSNETLESESGDGDSQMRVFAYNTLDFDSVPYTGSGTPEDPYVFLVSYDNSVILGSFLNRMAGYADEAGKSKINSGSCFVLEVRAGDSLDGEVIYYMSKKGSYLKPCPPNAKYYILAASADANEKNAGIFDGSGVEPPEYRNDSANGGNTPGNNGNNDFSFYDGNSDVSDYFENNNNVPTDNDGIDDEYGFDENDYSSGSDERPYVTDDSGSGDVYDFDENDYDTYVDNDSTGSSSDGAEVYTKSELQKEITEKEQSIKDLELEMKESKLKIDKEQAKLDKAIVKSTMDGVVQSVAAADTSSSEPFIKISSTGGKFVKGNINELMLDKFKEGQVISGVSNSNGAEYEAVINEISKYPVSDEMSPYDGMGNPNSSYYPFTAKVTSGEESLADDEYVQINMNKLSDGQSEDGDLEQSEDLNGESTEGQMYGGEIESPYSNEIYLNKAYIRKEDGRYYVYKDVGGVLKKQYIKVGKTVWDYYTEVKEGIEMSDSIAFPYGNGVKDGAKTEAKEYPEGGFMTSY